MESISLDRSKQKKVVKRVKTLKKSIKSGEIKIENNPKIKNKNKKCGSKERTGGGVIYIGHIPHGFYENEMKGFFSQFGKVLTTVVARSKKTGRSKGYGFVEFKDEDVAKIAAETMNNYLMYNRILKCRYISPEERKGKLYPNNLFKSYKKKKYSELSNNSQEKLDNSKYLKQTQEKIDKFKKFFEENGIEFSYSIDNADSEEGNVSKSSNKNSSQSSSRTEEDPEGVLEIDESDDDIQFKTPPQIKKVFKKSLISSATPSKIKSPVKKENKIKKTKNLEDQSIILKDRNISRKTKASNSKIIKVKAPKQGKKVNRISQGIGRKLEKKTEKKELPVKKSIDLKRKEGGKSKVAVILKKTKESGNANFKMVASKNLKKNKSSDLKKKEGKVIEGTEP